MGLFSSHGGLSKLFKKSKNVASIIAAPFTGGVSLLANDKVQNKIGDIWDDFTGKTAVEKANAANAVEAQKNRDWQEQMSNTAITRQQQDLLNAGINPNLAATLGGASVGSGAQATMQAEPSGAQGFMNAASIAGTVANGFNAIGAGVNQMAQAAKTNAETPYVPQAQKANIANTTADTVQKQAQTQNINADTQKIKAETSLIAEQLQTQIAQTDLTNQQALSQKLNNIYESMTGSKMPQGGYNKLIARIYEMAKQADGNINLIAWDEIAKEIQSMARK